MTALIRLIAKIDATGSAEKRYGGGRPRTAHNIENVDSVQTLVLRQEHRPGTYRTSVKIRAEVSSVHVVHG